ncbi:hypothetical protein TRFO_17040 [Tritrichomonas foetus]|uniref:Uncharacterized protein n=1 Tax=Tritrichomonas foetus TaxID=1144522 RepID=A0A1J4KPS3_9EUKA|nr:hypothetical protein TRFO_17040 [Tritrichomonas foetus]|eukprot:OHT12896.1 hypothetical protein TRFO_17040 [Tritrichomonas foetus]
MKAELSTAFRCPCGSVSCRNIRVRSIEFPNQITHSSSCKNHVYSSLHHNSLKVVNQHSIVVDKCCGNCLCFHCSHCHEQFSILILKKSMFVIGFSPSLLTEMGPSPKTSIVKISEFPICLKSYVSYSETNENVKCSINSKINNVEVDDMPLLDMYRKAHFSEDDENCLSESEIGDEICSYDSDIDIMFGNKQNLVIGKYNEWSMNKNLCILD